MLWRNTIFNVNFIFIGYAIVINLLLGDEVVLINRFINVNAVADVTLNDFDLDLEIWFKCYWCRFLWRRLLKNIFSLGLSETSGIGIYVSSLIIVGS